MEYYIVAKMNNYCYRKTQILVTDRSKAWSIGMKSVCSGPSLPGMQSRLYHLLPGRYWETHLTTLCLCQKDTIQCVPHCHEDLNESVFIKRSGQCLAHTFCAARMFVR